MSLTSAECPDGIVDSAALDRVYDRLQVAGGDAEMDGADEVPDGFMKVVNAFKMPRLCFNAEKKAFEKCVAHVVGHD